MGVSIPLERVWFVTSKEEYDAVRQFLSLNPLGTGLVCNSGFELPKDIMIGLNPLGTGLVCNDLAPKWGKFHGVSIPLERVWFVTKNG